MNVKPDPTVERVNRVSELQDREKAIKATATQLFYSGSYGWREAIVEAVYFVDELRRRSECVDRGEKPWTDLSGHHFSKEEGGDEDDSEDEEKD